MKNKDLEIRKLYSLLQDNAQSSDLMCKHYCCQSLITHINYQNKINTIKFFNHLKFFNSDYDLIDLNDLSSNSSTNSLIQIPPWQLPQ